MRIAIVGAGALGSLFACLLKEAGQDVVLVERNRHTIRAIRSQGIWLIDGDGRERNVRVDITLSPRLEGPVDVILLFVKSYDTPAAVRCTQHVHGERTLVGSFQNGLGNLEAIAEVVPAPRIFAGSLAYSSMQIDHNRIQYTGGAGPLRLAKYDNTLTPDFVTLADVFRRTGYPVEISDDCVSSVWNKVLMNAGANALSVLTGMNCGEMVRDERLRRIMDLVVREAATVAARLGVRVDQADNPSGPLFRALEGIGTNKTTMLQDFERGARIEIDALNGAVVSQARRMGLSVPLNEVVTLLVQQASDRRSRGEPAAPSSERVVGDELDAVSVMVTVEGDDG